MMISPQQYEALNQVAQRQFDAVIAATTRDSTWYSTERDYRVRWQIAAWVTLV